VLFTPAIRAVLKARACYVAESAFSLEPSCPRDRGAAKCGSPKLGGPVHPPQVKLHPGLSEACYDGFIQMRGAVEP